MFQTSVNRSPENKKPIRVLLMDDHLVTLDAIGIVIRSDMRFALCGQARSPQEALALCSSVDADVAVMRTEAPDLDFLKSLLACGKQKVLLVAPDSSNDISDAAILLGVRGIVTKNEGAASFLAAIEKVHRDELWLNRDATSRIVRAVAEAKRKPQSIIEEDPLDRLTSKELAVLKAVVAAPGKPLKVIAGHLHISQQTLRNHLSTIYEKLEVSGRLELYSAYAHLAESRTREKTGDANQLIGANC